VQKPFADRNETITTVDVSDYSVVSSGIYERHFEKDGRNYHHILDPSTGYPYDNGLTSVTILSPTSTEGDGLSTTCFALGLDAGMALINETEDVEAAFISSDGKIHYSSGFPRT
ncbi:MAG: FAD:protein FMN transferase, partial [Clostridia bacterium]|nr:FAD:protein FMN transferase [Clostridia bacterium]